MSSPSPSPIVVAIDGAAASGKSSTSAMVADALGFFHADSGAMYRTETARRLGIDDIRSPEVTAQVSAVAALPEVRAAIDAQLREMARTHNIVVDGRDIGAVVFPNAAVKVFLVADPIARATRRLRQRTGAEPTPEAVTAEVALLAARDARDAAHTIQAPDAVVIDTTNLTQAEQVHQIVALVHARTTTR